jgi:hypothetical protein
MNKSRVEEKRYIESRRLLTFPSLSSHCSRSTWCHSWQTKVEGFGRCTQEGWSVREDGRKGCAIRLSWRLKERKG